MIEERKLEDKFITPFKAKPVPPTTLQPKFESIRSASEQRRKQIKQKCIEKALMNDKPFSFYERDKNKPNKVIEPYKVPEFKANPIPKSSSVLIYDQKLK